MKQTLPFLSSAHAPTLLPPTLSATAKLFLGKNVLHVFCTGSGVFGRVHNISRILPSFVSNCSVFNRSSKQHRASQAVLAVNSLPANAGDVRDAGSIPGSEVPLEEGMATMPVIVPGEP